MENLISFLKENTKNVVITVIVVLIVLWVIGAIRVPVIDTFSDISYADNYNINQLYDRVNDNCKMEYCGATTYSPFKTQLPAGYEVSNLTNSVGCCILSRKLKDFIYTLRGGNA